jgi:hypothetical protein
MVHQGRQRHHGRCAANQKNVCKLRTSEISPPFPGKNGTFPCFAKWAPASQGTCIEQFTPERNECETLYMAYLEFTFCYGDYRLVFDFSIGQKKS